MSVTHLSRRESRCDISVSHAHVTPVVTVPPTRPDPTRPISVVGVASGVFNSGQFQTDRHLGRIGFGDLR